MLTVVGDNGQTTFIASKSTSTDPDSWVTEVTSSDRIDNLFTNNNKGIGFDGSNLLFIDYDNGKIIKVSLATRSIIGNITTDNSLNTVEYDGANYWVSRNGYNTISKVDNAGTTLFTTSSSLAMGSWLYGIGYISPTSIICYSNSSNAIYNYNPATDALVGTKLLPGISLGDIAVSNGKIYIIQYGGTFIYRLDPATFAVEKAYNVPEANGIIGIASVGTGVFWLNTNAGKNILKVTLN